MKQLNELKSSLNSGDSLFGDGQSNRGDRGKVTEHKLKL